MAEHKSVMADEAINLLNIKDDGIYVDGTLGRGGHSRLILEKLKKGKLYVFDLDEEAIRESKEKLKEYDNVIYIHDNFCHMNKYVEKADGILLDLGVSSPQFDDGQRGFSYRYDAQLDMRMDKSQALNARDVVNYCSLNELADIFRNYGEEKFALPIARNICLKRAEKPIETTFELVDIIKSALPPKVLSKKGHPAKQCFLALRVYVNKEYDSLNTFLASFDQILNKDGRLVIITFHSIEDKLVKYRFKELTNIYFDKHLALRPEEIKKAPYSLLNHKAIVASQEELEMNRRSKSAKLRGIIKNE